MLYKYIQDTNYKILQPYPGNKVILRETAGIIIIAHVDSLFPILQYFVFARSEMLNGHDSSCGWSTRLQTSNSETSMEKMNGEN